MKTPTIPHLELFLTEQMLTIKLDGHLQADNITPAWRAAQQAIIDKTEPITIDAQQVEYCDGAAIAMLFDLRQRAGERFVKFIGLKPPLTALLEQFNVSDYQAPTTKPQKSTLFDEIGRASYQIVQDSQRQVIFIGQLSLALLNTLRRPKNIRWQDTAAIAEHIGFNAVPIVSLIAFILGVILAFQSASSMKQFGAEMYVADLIGLSLFRELSPLLTAILLAGRSGAAFAAEIGTMKVNEEINALTTMGLEPMQFLVVPRIIAATLTTPLLIIIADAIGALGGAVVMAGFDIPMQAFAMEMFNFIGTNDFLIGVFKGGVFGFIIAAIGCMRGLETKNGAIAVGQSTTSAVVTIIVLVVVLDGLFAVLFTQLGI
jgi:phospholipid/cholesterol/gamma-HCH transport system permease protein